MTTYFRDEIKRSRLLIGSWISTVDPFLVEAIAQSAFDLVVFDAEHGALDRVSLATNVLVASGAKMRTIVRLGGDGPVHYMQPLDAGADGVLVPRVRNASEVRRAVDLCRYAPDGSRGYGPRRAGGYLRREAAYAEAANASVAVLVQIETREAVQNLDEILAVEGLDGILVGRNDLAASLGLPRDHRHPELLRVTADILSRARDAGLARAIAAGADPRAVPELAELGANVIVAGADVEYLVRAIDRFLDLVAAHRIR